MDVVYGLLIIFGGIIGGILILPPILKLIGWYWDKWE